MKPCEDQAARDTLSAIDRCLIPTGTVPAVVGPTVRDSAREAPSRFGVASVPVIRGAGSYAPSPRPASHGAGSVSTPDAFRSARSVSSSGPRPGYDTCGDSTPCGHELGADTQSVPARVSARRTARLRSRPRRRWLLFHMTRSALTARYARHAATIRNASSPRTSSASSGTRLTSRLRNRSVARLIASCWTCHRR